ncbi:MAG: hypothetical protein KKC80_00995 [Candidatus Margulisbacteria bacterium]|nr:hypothetical protein [Candidatus Margulisiibacteriota bacterium]
MAKLAKNILLVLLLAACLPLAATAAQSPTPYPVAYWVNGALQKDASSLPPTLDGFKLYFYKAPGNGFVPTFDYAVASSDASGNFSINALEDLSLTPLAAATYYFGVEKKEFTVGGVKRSWGINETAVDLSQADINSGYKNIAESLTTLVEGAGLTPSGETSGLTIFRAGDTKDSNILIAWDTKIFLTPPNIYARTGDGNGLYVSDYDSKWVRAFDGTTVLGGLPAELGSFKVDPLIPNTLVHEKQVGSGSVEVYYKAYLGATNPPTGADLAAFSSAPAVGKLIVVAYGSKKNNAIGIPFVVSSGKIDDVLSTTLQQKDIEYLKFDSSTQQYAGGYYDSGWKGTAITLSQGDGIWIYNPITGSDIVMTIVGNVPKKGLAVSCTIFGPKKNNKIALPHPQGAALTLSGLDPLAGSEILIFDNFNQTYTGTYVDSGNWKSDLWVKPGKGFWYYNLNGTFDWSTMVKK